MFDDLASGSSPGFGCGILNVKNSAVLSGAVHIELELGQLMPPVRILWDWVALGVRVSY